MLRRTRPKFLGALVATLATVLMMASPASAAVACFRITAGIITVTPVGGDPIVFDLVGDEPHDCAPDPPLPDSVIHIDIEENTTPPPDYITEVVGANINPSYVDLEIAPGIFITILLELFLSTKTYPVPDNSGEINEIVPDEEYEIEQNIALQAYISLVENCEPIALLCAYDLQLALAGIFEGTINPTVGTATVSGGGTLVEKVDPPCLLEGAFDGAQVDFDPLVLEKP